MNEQKLIQFWMLIPKSTGHCFSNILVAITKSEALNYTWIWGQLFSPLRNTYAKRDMHKSQEMAQKHKLKY